MKKSQSYITSIFIVLLSWAVSFSAIASSWNQNKITDKIENTSEKAHDEPDSSENQELNEFIPIKIINNIVSFQLEGNIIKYFKPTSQLFIPETESPDNSELVLELLPIAHVIFNHYVAPNAP